VLSVQVELLDDLRAADQRARGTRTPAKRRISTAR
jgi:hypothetical protein